MTAPWTEGPKELLQHAADHLRADGDFDRRIAMISIDNAVELAVKTYLGLPKRARGTDGPSRSKLEAASESFPALLDLLDQYATDRLTGIDLGDIEWYHRLRNQLYHSGNGITVDRPRVEAYYQVASALFESLFDAKVEVDDSDAIKTRTGEFLQLWSVFEYGLRVLFADQERPAYDTQREYLESVSPEAAQLSESLMLFRNNLVHSLDVPSTEKFDTRIDQLRRLLKILNIVIG